MIPFTTNERATVFWVRVEGDKMRIYRFAASLAALLLLLCACANAIPQVPFDKGASGNIKKIGIITPRFPDQPYAMMRASEPAIPIIGTAVALTELGIQASRESRLDALLKAQNFSAREFFTQIVTTELEASTYEVFVIPIKRETADFAAVYPTSAPPTVDAYLDVVVQTYGYVALGKQSNPPWFPWFILRARLVNAKTSEVLMQRTISYNPYGPSSTVTESTNSFVSFDSLESDPISTMLELRAAIEQVAKMLAATMK